MQFTTQRYFVELERGRGICKSKGSSSNQIMGRGLIIIFVNALVHTETEEWLQAQYIPVVPNRCLYHPWWHFCNSGECLGGDRENFENMKYSI